MYFKRNNKSLVIIAVYVDDLLILASNEKVKTSLKKKLSQTFDMKDLGEAKYLLGMNITRDRKARKIWLDQSTYIQKMLQKFGIDEQTSFNTFRP